MAVPQLKLGLLAACVVANVHAFAPPRAALLPARRTAGKAADAGKTAGRIIVRAAPEELENPVAKDAPAYALAVAAQAIPVVTTDKLSHYVFFLALSATTVYLGSRAPSLAPPEEQLTFKQAALAPVAAGVSLTGLYFVITVLKLSHIHI